MKGYPPFKCQYYKFVTRERGDFEDFTERGRKLSRFVVKETYDGIVPCLSTRYKVVDEHPFSIESGKDPLGILVKCLDCDKESYLFPVLKKHTEVGELV